MSAPTTGRDLLTGFIFADHGLLSRALAAAAQDHPRLDRWHAATLELLEAYPEPENYADSRLTEVYAARGRLEESGPIYASVRRFHDLTGQPMPQSEAILDRVDGTVPDSELEKVKTAVFINEINRQGF